MPTWGSYGDFDTGWKGPPLSKTEKIIKHVDKITKLLKKLNRKKAKKLLKELNCKVKL